MSKSRGGLHDAGAYRFLKVPGHPRANSKGYVREHILIAEKALGHHLPKAAVVHHHDRNGHQNANSNLVICPDQSYHLLLHARMRAFEASGNANWKRCIHCGKYDDPATMSRRDISSRKNPEHYHQACNAEAVRNWRQTGKTSMRDEEAERAGRRAQGSLLL